MVSWTDLFFSIGVAIFLAIILALSVIYQYVPRNDVETQNDSPDMTVLVRRDSTILVPLWSIINPVESNLQVTIFHKNSTAFATLPPPPKSSPPIKGNTLRAAAINQFHLNVEDIKLSAPGRPNPSNTTTLPTNSIKASPFTVINIKLSTSADSILSYSGEFKPAKPTKTVVNVTNGKTIANKQNQVTNYTVVTNYTNSNPSVNIYSMNVTARHNLEIKNSTDPYTIYVYFQNKTGVHAYPISFNWPIKTLDFNIFTYFMIVLIGVVVSKYTSKIIEPENAASAGSNTSKFKQQDYIWIGISGVIALLIFSNFQQQVNLTSHLITNISLAFGFGFGFDKILETSQKLAKK